MTVRVPRWDPEEVTLFLGDRAETHPGPERPSDLFNGTGDFVPVEDARGDIVFLRRDGLAVVEVAVADEELDAAYGGVPDEDAEMGIALCLDDGETLEGTAFDPLPKPRQRVQDLLNREGAFLRMRRGESVILVNKHRIARVTER